MFNYNTLQLRNKDITVNTVYHSIFLYYLPKILVPKKLTTDHGTPSTNEMNTNSKISFFLYLTFCHLNHLQMKKNLTLDLCKLWEWLSHLNISDSHVCFAVLIYHVKSAFWNLHIYKFGLKTKYFVELLLEVELKMYMFHVSVSHLWLLSQQKVDWCVILKIFK
jgi:hypothetical protein